MVVIVFILVFGFVLAEPANWSAQEGGFAPFGLSGILAGTATCFYAFVGFDVIAASSEEASNPQRAVPAATAISLGLAATAYVLVSTVLTLMVPWHTLDPNSALSDAFFRRGYSWAGFIVAVGSICGEYELVVDRFINGQSLESRGMPTLKDCYICRKKIGVATKTCLHCSAKQPYKQKLEGKKKQLSQEWKDRQKKNSSVNKVYDATNLLLHKWELLERYPVLFLARRTSNGFSVECFCPWKMDTEDVQDAFVTIKRLYESLLNAVIPSRWRKSNISKQHGRDSSNKRHTDRDSSIRQHKCPIHKDSTSFPYQKILRKRIREGHVEVLVQWHPCSGCGMKWKNSWEPQENIQSSS
ncbi:hypothetical protein G5714_009022 [Onychostoma macrolepis]|uniref:Chromo domain-containing protein n=1 Tax=Onychostoma macrolepis TaxID=369639 RepID=A0A7J6CR89_9TELE|nr:hypothetical protein G5714_009022 [Onychostoma macrolepis]